MNEDLKAIRGNQRLLEAQQFIDSLEEKDGQKES